MEGQIVGGRYELVRQLGEGGMGVVFEATDTADGSRVAIKLIVDPVLAANAAIVRRFYREALTASRLRCPNIVNVRDTGTDPETGTPYMVMDLLVGQDASQLSSCSGPIRPFAAAKIVAQAALGLVKAHEIGVVHRDIKPANIFLADSGDEVLVKLLDFGIAKIAEGERDAGVTSHVTKTGSLLGTPLYMSPEQAEGLTTIDARTDLWSLGVVLYELVAGRTPFASFQSVGQIILAICSKPLLPIEVAAPWVPESLARVVGQLLERNLAVRLASATMLVEELRKLLPDGSSSLRPTELVRMPSTERGSGRRSSAEALTLDAADSARLVALGEAPTVVTTATLDSKLHGPERGESTRAMAGVGVDGNGPEQDEAVRKLDAKGSSKNGTDGGRRRMQPFAWVGAAALVAAAGLAGWLTLSAHGEATQGAGAPSRARVAARIIAVLEPKPIPGRPERAWLSTALAEMLAMDLSVAEGLRAAAGADVARARRDMKEGEVAAGPSTALLDSLQKNLGADLVLAGSITEATQDTLRLELRMLSSATGESVAVWRGTGRETDLIDLAARASESLRIAAGAHSAAPDEVRAARTATPAALEPMRQYARGLSMFRSFDTAGAVAALEAATAAAPDHALAHSALAEAFTFIGSERRARAEAKLAFDLTSGIGREQTLLVEARYRVALHQFDAAVVVYRRLTEAFPEELVYSLTLAQTQYAAGKAKEASATLAELRQRPTPFGDDPRIDIVDAHGLAEVVGDARAGMLPAVRAAKTARARGMRWVLAAASYYQAYAYYSLAEYSDARRLAEEAKALYAEVGDMRGVANTLSVLAGSDLGTDKLTRALDSELEAVDRLRALDAESDLGEAINNAAQLAAMIGRFDDATKLLEESTVIARAADDRRVEALAQITVGRIAWTRGEASVGVASLRASAKQFHDSGDKASEAWALDCEATVLRDQGDAAAATEAFEAALRAREELGLKGFAAESRLGLAQMALDAGKAVEAENLARLALDAFRAEKSRTKEGLATATLAEALQLQGKSGEATDAAEQAWAAASTSEDLDARVLVALSTARILANSGRRDDARRRAEAALADAKSAGAERLVLEAQLEVAALRAVRDPAGARSDVAAIVANAHARGFERLARAAKTEADRAIKRPVLR